MNQRREAFFDDTDPGHVICRVARGDVPPGEPSYFFVVADVMQWQSWIKPGSGRTGFANRIIEASNLGHSRLDGLFQIRAATTMGCRSAFPGWS